MMMFHGFHGKLLPSHSWIFLAWLDRSYPLQLKGSIILNHRSSIGSLDHWIIPKLPTTLATSPTSDRKCFDLGCSFTCRGNSSKTSFVVRRCLQLTQAPVEDQFFLSLVLRTKQVERNDPKAVAERPGVSRFPRLLWLFRNLRGSTGMHWAAGAKSVSQQYLSLCLSSRQIPPLW